MSEITSLDLELGQLENAQLVRRLDEEERVYLFKHALTQETAYQTLLHKTQRELHRRVAEAYAQVHLGNLDEFTAVLSEHYWLAEAWGKAAECALLAGEHAMRTYALREAFAQYSRALQALDRIEASPEQIIDATLSWIRPAMSFVPYAELLERLARVEKIARERNDKRRLAQILHWLTDVHFVNGYTTRAAPALFENYRLATDLGDEPLSLVPSFWLAFFIIDRDPRGALAQFEKVLDLARKHHNREIEAYILSSQALVHARLGQFAQSRQELRQAHEMIQTISSLREVADANTLTGFTFLEMGELERALEYAQRGAEKAKQGNVPECESAGLLGVGLCQLQAHALGEAEGAFDRSVRLAESAGSDTLRNQALAGLAVAHFASGQSQGVAEMETALANSKAIGDAYSAAFLSQMLGEAYTRLDPVRAESYLSTALDFYRRNEMRPSLARTLQSAAGLYDQQGRATDAVCARSEAEALTKELGLGEAAERV